MWISAISTPTRWICFLRVSIRRLIKEPTVIAELLAGIILGPTVLGRIPNFTDTIFPDSSLPMLKYDTELPLHY